MTAVTWEAIESRRPLKKKVMTADQRGRQVNDKGRQAGLHGIPGKSSRRGRQQLEENKDGCTRLPRSSAVSTPEPLTHRL